METITGTMRRLEEVVKKSDNDGLRARWESGRCMLAHRNGNRQLPSGLLADLERELGVHRSELTARMKFAEKYHTDEELTNVISKFKTWFAIKQHALTTTPRVQKQAQPCDADATVDGPEDADDVDVDSHPVPKDRPSPLTRVIAMVERIDPAELQDGDQEQLVRLVEVVNRLKDAVATLTKAAA